jgi:hypothetical protein
LTCAPGIAVRRAGKAAGYHREAREVRKNHRGDRGLIAATFIGVFLIPLLNVVFQRLRSRCRAGLRTYAGFAAGSPACLVRHLGPGPRM